MADEILTSDFDNAFDRIVGSRTTEQEAAAKANGHLRELPKLVIARGNLTVAAQTLAKLFAENRCFLSNGYAPVKIAVLDGMPGAIEVSPDMIRMEAHKLCRPVKAGEKRGEFIDVTLSKDVANLYLYGMAGDQGLDPLHGITAAPILEEDGTIRIVEGYDVKTGLYCSDIPQVTVPDHPNEIDAAEALYRLRDYFKAFAWDDSVRLVDDNGVNIVDLSKNPIGLDESTFLVMLLTAVVRQSIELAPAALFGAPKLSGSGTGKGLLVRCMIIIATGVSPKAFTAGHDQAELEKRLVAVLVEGRPANFFDNFNAQELKSDALASALTENPATVRVLGQTKLVPLHTRSFLGITGNGIAISEDLARRMLKTHLNARVESPEQRDFDKGVTEFIEQVKIDRAKLLSDVLTIWRWGRQNRNDLKRGRAFGSYEVWARWCRDPLLTLGCRDPIDRTAELKAADPQRLQLVEVFERWRICHAKDELKASDLNDAVLMLIDERAEQREGGLKYRRQTVQAFLAQCTDTMVAGYTLLARKAGPPSKPTKLYRLDYKDEGEPSAEEEEF